MKKLVFFALISLGFTLKSQTIDTAKCDNARNLTYLSDNEKDMIFQINIVRTNPKSYIPYIQERIARNKSMLSMITSGKMKVNSTVTTKGKSSTSTISMMTGETAIQNETKYCEELIKLLDTLAPMGVLTPRQDMAAISKSFNNFLDSTKVISHFGPNGSTPLDRFKHLHITASENLSSTPTQNSVINAMIMLLVDPIPNSGHRYNILNRNWKYVSVSSSDFVIVQNFAK